MAKLGEAKGEEFRARKGGPLTAETVRELNRQDDGRALLSVVASFGLLAAAAGAALVWWTPWVVVPAILVLVSRQHAMAILAHEATHYRLFSKRWLNEAVGRLCGYLIGISMPTYRVVHRLHHNHLYQKIDPDIPLMAGYPRGRAYLARKLTKDVAGFTAHKNYAYFFGAPGTNRETGQASRPLADTSPRLRQQALADRWVMVAVQAALLAAAVASGHALEYLVLWLVPLVTLFQALLRFRAVLEHGAPSGFASPLHAARTNLCPAWAAWFLFPLSVNYHIEHHLYPAVPHYNLKRAHQALTAAGALAGAEVRPVAETISRVFAPPSGAAVQTA